jgi:hypothetical protein
MTPQEMVIIVAMQLVAAQAACWEAYMPHYYTSSCSGYASAGYTCVGDYCAAVDPGGTPSICAKPKGDCSVDRATGRCSACAPSTPSPPAPPAPPCAQRPPSPPPTSSDVTVSGELSCHAGSNAVYQQQPTLRNGRPQFATVDGSSVLYWTAFFSTTGSAAWLINDGLEDAGDSDTVYLIAGSDAPPTGSAVWMEKCGGESSWTGVRLQLAGGQEASSRATPVLHETVCHLQELHTHDFAFEAQSGHRYGVEVRVGEATGFTTPCTSNQYDVLSHGSAASEQSQTCAYALYHLRLTCSADFCAECPQAHYCDLACGFLCAENGISATLIYVLPPGATEIYQAVATEATAAAADKGLGFTATATGTYVARVMLHSGSGDLTLTVTTVGAMLDHSPELVLDGPHQLTVDCHFSNCGYRYDGAQVMAGDGSGFDLQLDVEAGHAYAFRVELPHAKTAAQVSATIYQAGAAAGAAGFRAVVDGPLGKWSATPAGSQSLAAYKRCNLGDDDGYRHCMGGLVASFGIHPGERFDSGLTGTWVSPTSGAVLLRLVMNCDVPFYADVRVEGCIVGGDNIRCDPIGDGTRNSDCVSELRLTVTRDAYYDQDGDTPIIDTARRTDIIVVDSESVVDQAAAVFNANPGDFLGLHAPPTMDEMLVKDTAAYELLTQLFSMEQQPSVVYPTQFTSSRRRQLQHGDISTVTIETHGPSAADVGAAQHRLVNRLPGAQLQGRRQLQVDGEDSCPPGGCHADSICGLGSTNTGCTADGQVVVQTHITLPNAGLLSMVNDIASGQNNHVCDFDDMQVVGSLCNARQAAVFIDTQSPLQVLPTAFTTDQSHHRRLQHGGDRLHVTIETHAATATEAAGGVHRLATERQGKVVGTTACVLSSRTEAVNDECCDEPDEDCSSGLPTSCNLGCAAVVLPFFDDCADALGAQASSFDDVLVLCEKATK